MDLIERRAAIEEVDDTVTSVSVCATVEQARGATWAKKRIRERLEKMPTIEAVPLDKLCEWLGGHGMLAPCYFDQKCDHCNLSPYWRREKSECWRHMLTEWMEGLDDC